MAFKMDIKLFLFFVIINIIFEDIYQKKEFHKFEIYYSKSICKFLYFTINYNCPTTIFSSTSFYDEILEINRDINLLINIKISKLENIFFLLGIIPFLKNNSTLSYKINNKEINIFFKKIFKNKRIKNKIINFDYKDFNIFNVKINELLNYIWEFVPGTFTLDNLRYVINNFYDESNFEIPYETFYQTSKYLLTQMELKSFGYHATVFL